MRMTVGSICSGIGGFDLAFQRAGFHTDWFIEIDPDCQRILRRHWPDTPIISDAREANDLPHVDVIVGGTPCQDLSVAGLRKGLDGERSSIFYEYIRICQQLQPAFAVWENVFGALSSNSGRDFAVILASFRELGARDIGWTTLDAVYFGVPQFRRRVFVVADFAGKCAAEILFESARLPRHPSPRRKAGQRVAACLTAGVAKSRGVNKPGRRAEDDVNLVMSKSTDGALTASSYSFGADENHASAGHLIEVSEGAVGSLQGHHPRFDADSAGAGHLIPQTSGTLSSRLGKGPNTTVDDGSLIAFTNRGSVGDAHETLRAESHGAIPMVTHALTSEGADASEDGTGRGVPLVVPAFGVRRLMLIETERLQGFPDGWTEKDDKGKSISDSARYRMIGNSVAIPVVEWIARRLFTVLSEVKNAHSA